MIKKNGVYVADVTIAGTEQVMIAEELLELQEIHEKLGHPGKPRFERQLKNMDQKDLLLNLRNFSCEVCTRAKSTRHPFPKSNKLAIEVGELIHLD
ncbi:hypothetical protein HMI56_006117, partial [Coelomomyces lativittatus]